MNLIVGGAYQGKLEYACKKYGFGTENVYTCSENSEIVFDKPCIDRLEEFVMYCVKNDKSAREIMEKNADKWENSVLICREIFSGIVPIDDTVRRWREETGRVMTWVASRAETVTRLFCGIPQQLK